MSKKTLLQQLIHLFEVSKLVIPFKKWLFDNFLFKILRGVTSSIRAMKIDEKSLISA